MVTSFHELCSVLDVTELFDHHTTVTFGLSPGIIPGSVDSSGPSTGHGVPILDFGQIRHGWKLKRLFENENRNFRFERWTLFETKMETSERNREWSRT